MDQSINALKTKLKKKYTKKLKWLIKKQVKKPSKQSLNLSEVVMIIGDIQIPTQVQNLIKKGPSYAFRQFADIHNTIPKFEKLIRNMDETSKEREHWKYMEEFRAFKNRNLDKFKAMNSDRQVLCEAQKWIMTNSIKITREDKSRKMVIMEKSRYDEYMNNYLRKSGAKLLNKDPTTALEGKWDKIRQKKRTYPNS